MKKRGAVAQRKARGGGPSAEEGILCDGVWGCVGAAGDGPVV